MTTTFPLIIFAPAAPFFLAFLISLGGAIYRARRARMEAEAKAREQARKDVEDARRKQEAATRKAKQEAAAAAVKAQADREREAKARERAVKATETARAKELRRKMTAEELLKNVPANSRPFEGQKIAFTGRFPRVERSQLIRVVNTLGGVGHETAHASTTLLVLCPSSGAGQADRAQHWNIPTITWEQWYEQAFGKAPGPEFAAYL